jgi:ribonuclease-3
MVLDTLQKKLGYHFNSPEVLAEALTHPSLQDKGECRNHNQRLEFLGDSVLGSLLASWLFQSFPEEDEGKLSRKKAILARGEHLTRIARDLELNLYIQTGKSERMDSQKLRDSALEDALEAIIGAIFLDGGYEAARKVMMQFEPTFHQSLDAGSVSFNPKGRLQEYVQSNMPGSRISYQVVRQSGPDHKKTFHVRVSLAGELRGAGSGLSKKAAEEQAAIDALASLNPRADGS